MQTYISILRGINVGGHNILKMEDFRKVFKNLNLKNVTTYIQSGNIIFQENKSPINDLENKISKKILEEFKLEVPTLVKELEDFKEIIKNNSFVNERNEDISKLHITFFSKEPEKTKIDEIKNGKYASDEFIFSDKVVYLFCPNGYGNTKLTNTFFEKKLKVSATTRNWKTINELIKIAENISKI